MNILINIVPVVMWNDLIQMKPEGIEDSINPLPFLLLLLGASSSTTDELKEEDLV